MLRCLLAIRHPVGGIRTHVAGLLRSVDFADVSGDIVLPDVDEARDLEGQLADTGLRCIFTHQSSHRMTATINRLAMTGGYNLAHAHGFTAGVMATPVCRVVGLPIIITAHDVFTAQQFAGLQGTAKRLAMAATLRLTSMIHCVTRDAADNLDQYIPGIPPGKIRIIPHGIDVPRFRDAQPRNLRQELGLADDALLIGFFGRFMAQKGFRLLLQALRQCLDSQRLPKATYIVCLDTGGFLREDQLLAREMGVDGHLRVLPFTPFIGPEIKGVDVVAMPSLWEASGLLAMEALVAGTPLIAASCTGLRETIAGTPALAFPPGDVDALANALAALPGASRIRQAFQAYQPEAAERFRDSKSYNLIRQLYDEVSGRQAG